MPAMLEVISWYLIISLTGWLVFPIAFRLFRFLPERGITLTRPLSLLLWGYVFWLLASLGVLENNTGGVLFALVIVLLISLGAALGKFSEILEWIRTHGRTVLAAELLFLGAFLLWVFVRAADPEILNTEKPMEMAFINSILRSPSFPPVDPWLSGYSISYYYFGYVMISMIIRLTGTATTVAFNINIALWFALTGAAAYGVLYNLIHLYFNRQKKESHWVQRKAIRWAFLAPLFILLLGNLSGILEILHARGAFWNQLSDGTYQSNFWTWLNINDLNQAPPQPFSWEPHRGGWSWWAGSRVLSDYNLLGTRQEVIDEFPFFSYLLADTHPHVLAMPFVLLAIALALNLLIRGHSTPLEDVRFSDLIKRGEFWFAAVLFGGLSFLNTWDFPIYVGLYSAVYTYLRFHQLGWSRKRWIDFLGTGFLLGAAGAILYLPFYVGFASQAGGLLPSGIFYTRGIHFWIMFAPLLVPIFLWLGHIWQQNKKDLSIKSGIKFAGGVVLGLTLLMVLVMSLANMAQIVGQSMSNSMNIRTSQMGEKITEYAGKFFANQGGIGSQLLADTLVQRLQSPGTWITLLLILTGTWALLIYFGKEQASAPVELATDALPEFAVEEDVNPNGFVLLLVLLGAGLTLFPEYFYLLDGFGTRMNTIFKFYFQAWILWGLAAAFGFTVLWHELRGVKARIVKPVLVFILIAALAYPAIMLPAKIAYVSGGNPIRLNLNGLSSYYSQDDRDSFSWLNQAEYGVVLEATGPQYRPDFARAGTYSGLPTVLGWAGHEGQWRGGYTEIGSRAADIEQIYTTNDWEQTKSLLMRYNIRYVYIGSTERSAYRVNETKFKANLTQVFANSTVIIYEVPDYAALGSLSGK